MTVLSDPKTLNADGTTSALSGGGGGVSEGDVDTAIATHAADTTSVHGITDTASLILEGDTRLTDARTPLTHTHDDRYYTETEVNTALGLKQDASTAATDAELSAHTGNTSNPHSVTKTQVGLGSVDNTSDAGKPVSTAQQTALDAKQPLDGDLTAIAALTTTSYGRAFLALADAAAGRTALSLGTAATSASGDFQPVDADLTSIAALTTTAFGRGFLDLADAAAGRTKLSAYSTAQVDAAFQPLDADLTAIAALATTATGRSLLAAADAAAIRTIASAASSASVPNASYRTLLDVSGSHIAGRAGGTYGFGQGDPLAVSGTGTLYPLNILRIVAADYPTLDGVAPKLRVRAQLYVNDAAPTGNFTFALHPVSRPAGVTGGAGVVIYTIGAAVAGSAATQISTPAADSSTAVVGSDFALPSDGDYVLGCVTTATVATSSHLHMSAILQMRNN